MKVFTIGQPEKDREMRIAAAIADKSLLAKISENDADLAKLSRPAFHSDEAYDGASPDIGIISRVYS